MGARLVLIRQQVCCAAMKPARASASAVVIGGGIIGLFTALRLREAGFAVTVIERAEVGRSASWAGGGILCPLYPWRVAPAIWALTQDSLASYPEICQRLAMDTGIDPEWTASGMMVTDRLETEDTQALQRWVTTAGMPVEQTSRRLPGQPPRPCLWLPWVAQLRNPSLCQALALRLRQIGVEIRTQTGAAALETVGTRARIVGTGLEPDVIVACGGAWTPALLNPLQWALPIQPVRGQMLLFRGPPGLLSEIVLEQDRYLIPRRDGYILAGSTVEPDAGFDVAVTRIAHDQLRAFAVGLLPALASQPIERQWAGLRPGTPDGIPIIAKHPQLSNLFVNAGHYRNGLTLAPASAKRLMQLVHAAA